MIPRYAAIWISTDCRNYRPHHKNGDRRLFFAPWIEKSLTPMMMSMRDIT